MTRAALALTLALAGCGGRHAGVRPESYLRIGVDPQVEASAVIDALGRAGMTLSQRVDDEAFVALAFVRESDQHRAIRVVTRVGVAVALDSHESDGVRVRHGAVRIVEGTERDLDRDGRPEIVLARDEGSRECLAIIRLYEDGHARSARIEAENVEPGSCASALEDVDGDGRAEALVVIAWEALAIDGQVPSLRVALAARDGGWRAGAMPAAYIERERESRRAALAAARARLDVALASRLGVELAALAHLAGATRDAQVRAYDDALSGLVLEEAERERVASVRAYVAGGWDAPE